MNHMTAYKLLLWTPDGLVSAWTTGEARIAYPLNQWVYGDNGPLFAFSDFTRALNARNARLRHPMVLYTAECVLYDHQERVAWQHEDLSLDESRWFWSNRKEDGLRLLTGTILAHAMFIGNYREAPTLEADRIAHLKSLYDRPELSL